LAGGFTEQLGSQFWKPVIAAQQGGHMEEQSSFFSENHNRLLSIATWAKILARVVLIVYLLWAVLLLFQNPAIFRSSDSIQVFFKDNFFDAFRLLVNVLATLLRGIIFYLFLKGLSLGLNMIVETDVNYRERQGG
jgi:preprotein translocase subunit SecG